MIVVKDRIMGSGKTHEAIEWMKDTKEKFVYITPFLSEVDRVLLNVNAYSPNNRNEDGSKKNGLLNLIFNGLNIASTHSCFKSLNQNDYIDKFKDYVLILDEVVDPLEILSISVKDILMLIESNNIMVNEDKSVSFIDREYVGRFSFLKEMCDTSNVFLISDTFLVWNFPIEIFKGFKRIEILTYLFEGSILSSYFKYNNIEYDVLKNNDVDVKNNIKELLFVYEGSSNDVGNKVTSLSVNWFSNNKAAFRKISFTTTNIFTRVFNTRSEENAYTTFKDYKGSLKGAGYSKGFIAVNARATNDFANKKSMAYLANRYYNPTITQFFDAKDIKTNQDLWALGELLQWVWRGCIRKGEPMNLYIPSIRMRTLLNKWLDNEL